MIDFISWLRSRKTAEKFTLLVMLVGMGLSVGFQKFGSFEPCKLCMVQRYLLSSAAATLIAGIVTYKTKNIGSAFFWLSLVFVASVFIVSAYQLLIQYDIVPEPAFCHKQDISEKSIEELLNDINNTNTSPCKSLGPTIFGIPISAFSCLGTLFCSMYLIGSQKD